MAICRESENALKAAERWRILPFDRAASTSAWPARLPRSQLRRQSVRRHGRTDPPLAEPSLEPAPSAADTSAAEPAVSAARFRTARGENTDRDVAELTTAGEPNPWLRVARKPPGPRLAEGLCRDLLGSNGPCSALGAPLPLESPAAVPHSTAAMSAAPSSPMRLPSRQSRSSEESGRARR